MLPNFAQTLYERFEREGIPLLLAGGWAVCHHGYTRLTLDVDWVCPRSRQAEAVALMDKLHFDKTSDGMASRFKHRQEMAFPYIDLIWVDDNSFRIMAETDITDTRAGMVPVINFRALIAMKLYALKDNVTRKGKDLLDLRFLLGQSHPQIPDAELRLMCEKYAGPDAYNKIKLVE